MDPVSILTLVGFGISSSTALYKIIDGLKSHKKEIRRLKAEIGDLNIVLQALAKNIEETTENFEVLRLILEQCVQACKSFEKEVLNTVGQSGSRVDEVKAWTRLQFMGGDISNFQRLIGNYKATMTIALADANLRTAKVTKQLLEKYTEMTQDTTSDLEDQIAELSHRLTTIQTQSTPNVSTDSNHQVQRQPIVAKQTQEQKAGLEQCLVVCGRLLDHIELARRAILQEATSTTGSANEKNATSDVDSLAPRLTADALQMCTHNISAAAQHLQDLRSARKITDDPDATQIMLQLDSARQCLDIVGKAHEYRVNVFEDIDTGDDSFQTVVSTMGDLIRAKGLRIGVRSVNIMGQMHDESLQKITNDWHANIPRRVSTGSGDVTFEKRHGFGHTIHPKG